MNTDSVAILCVVVLVILFAGDPDVADGIMCALSDDVCENIKEGK